MSPATRPRSACAGHAPTACVGLPPRPDRSETASVEQSTARQATIAGAPLIGGRLEGVRQHAAGGPFKAGSVAAAPLSLCVRGAVCGCLGPPGRCRLAVVAATGPTSPPQPPPCTRALAAFSRPAWQRVGDPPPGTACRSRRHCHHHCAGVWREAGHSGAVVGAAPSWWRRRVCPSASSHPSHSRLSGTALCAAWSVGAASDWRVAPYLPPPDQHHPAVTRRRLRGVVWGGPKRTRTQASGWGALSCCLGGLVHASVFFFFLSSLSRWRWREHVQRRSTLALPFVVESLYLLYCKRACRGVSGVASRRLPVARLRLGDVGADPWCCPGRCRDPVRL